MSENELIMYAGSFQQLDKFNMHAVKYARKVDKKKKRNYARQGVLC